MTAPSDTSALGWYVVTTDPYRTTYIARDEADAHAHRIDGTLAVLACSETQAKTLVAHTAQAIRAGMATVTGDNTTQVFGMDPRRCTLCRNRIGHDIWHGQPMHTDYHENVSGYVRLCGDCYPGSN